MKLSIILPVRNECNGIEEALNLIVSSIVDIDYEIVVINDFSDDASYKIVDKKVKENNKIRLFNNDKKGLGGAINLGITKSIIELLLLDPIDVNIFV